MPIKVMITIECDHSFMQLYKAPTQCGNLASITSHPMNDILYKHIMYLYNFYHHVHTFQIGVNCARRENV
jgi:hypothetical protein